MQAGQVISLGSTSTNVSGIGVGEEDSKVGLMPDGCALMLEYEVSVPSNLDALLSEDSLGMTVDKDGR